MCVYMLEESSIIQIHYKDSTIDFEFQPDDTYHNVIFRIKHYFNIDDDIQLYNDTLKQVMYFKQTTTVSQLLSSKALYTDDRITILTTPPKDFSSVWVNFQNIFS